MQKMWEHGVAEYYQANDGLCGKCHREALLEAEFRARQAATPPPPSAPKIEVRVDEIRFDEQQLFLMGEIVRTIRSELQQAGVEEEKLADVTSDIAFSIATMIDGSRVMNLEGRPLTPFLTFAEDSERTRLVARDGGSFMHEYVHGIVDDVFDSEDSADEKI